jgi:hypothetical protein
MRPVTIRKPLSSLRSARNLREVYDVLRLQQACPHVRQCRRRCNSCIDRSRNSHR